MLEFVWLQPSQIPLASWGINDAYAHTSGY